MKPVLYLDVDDTILSFNQKLMMVRQSPSGVSAIGAASFLRWADEHFEIRPLTMWAVGGTFSEEGAVELSTLIGMMPEWWLGLKGLKHSFAVDRDEWEGIQRDDKITGINWEEHEQGRPWFWVEDDLLPSEIDYLKGRGCFENYIRCNVSEQPARLIWVREELTRRLNGLTTEEN